MNSQPTQAITPTSQGVGNALSGISNTATSAIGGLTNSISDARNSFNTAVSDFSSKSAVDASNEFLESNTIVAKFAFIIIAVVIFMLLFRLGAIIMSYFFMPSTSPYLIKGMIGGSEGKIIKQDPKTEFPLVKISDNAETGIEFTYNVWLNLSGDTTQNTYKHVFSKGTGTSITSSGPDGTNAPGLYVITNADNTNSARIYMDTMENDGSLGSSPVSKYVDINNVPNNKWVNITIRVQNRIMDVYVNGVLTGRKDLEYIPRQNHSDVLICQKSGFPGKLSNLRYFDSALNVFEINQIVLSGPDTKTSKDSSSAQDATGFYYYLSSQFYQSNL
jgi:hypothetical protein